MTKIKVIKNEDEYREAISLASSLAAQDPNPQSEEGEKLELLSTLIKEYESIQFPTTLPDPIDAILFRMEQQNLRPSDLIPFIGNRSKVSEILSRKRPLTLTMIRALEKGLGIPAKILIQESNEINDAGNTTWERFPINEMEKRGYFGQLTRKTSSIKELMVYFFGQNPLPSQLSFSGLLKKSNYRSPRPMDKEALIVWSTQVIKKANQVKFLDVYDDRNINLDSIQTLIKLSTDKEGPLKAIAYLNKLGVAVIIEPHFPETYLDGAILFTESNHPIIGLTIRHDRIDNFWFTLMHEIAHLHLHAKNSKGLFYDNLDDTSSESIELEADKFACEALIPEKIWEASPARLVPSPVAAHSLATELHIHPAIVAGRMRRENSRYQYLNTLTGEGEISKLFPDIKWNK